MPISWNEMIESRFDPKTYREDPPTGTWKAKLDQIVYAKGSKVGIHIFLTDQSGEKLWFFARWLGGTPVHLFFKEQARLGDLIQIEVQSSRRSGKPYIKSVSKV